MRRTFEEDLQRAVDFHGHLCAGQVIGTRLARLGLSLFGLEGSEDARDIVVFVENDRCCADAVCVVAGAHPGKRRLKMYDYGKLAASFLDISTGKAYRIAPKEVGHCGHDDDPIVFFERFTDEEMFDVQAVKIVLDPKDSPGRPSRRIECEKCGERVLDGRDVEIDGHFYCYACAGKPIYYSELVNNE